MATNDLKQMSRTYEDTNVGDVIGPVVYGPLTVMHLVRWGAALENWHRIHYDYPFCTEHEGLPGPVINGSWKQQVLAQLLKEWAGPHAWVQALRYEFRGMDVVGETLTAAGRVTSRDVRGQYGELHCALDLTNSAGEPTTVGEAVVRLPMQQAGAEVRYPLGPHDGSGFSDASQGDGQYCPPQYRTYLGVTSDQLVSTDVVDASSVRRFMQAIMTRDPDYFDESGTGVARYGGVVAPPLYPLYPLRVPPTASDPLDRACRDPDFDGASQTPWSSFGLPEIEGAPKRILNGGNSIDLFAYAPLGTHIAVRSRYEEIFEKTGKRGPLLFVSVLSQYTIHETEQLLIRSRQTTILR